MICLGIDVGKQRDHSALVATEGEPEKNRRDITNAQRLPLGLDYTDQIGFMSAAAATADMTVVDAGGPGLPVIDHLRKNGHLVWALTITSGGRIRFIDEQRAIFVPKSALIGHISLLAEKGYLGLKRNTMELSDEMLLFGASATKTGYIKMEAMKGHDDLLLAACISLMGFVI